MTQRRFTPPPTRFAPRQAQLKAPAARPAGAARLFAPPPIPQRLALPAAQAKGAKPGAAPPPTRYAASAPPRVPPPARLAAPRPRTIQRAADPEIVVRAPANAAQAAELSARGIALRMAATDVQRLAETLGLDEIYEAAQDRLAHGTVYAEALRLHLWACVNFCRFAVDAKQALDGVLGGSAGGERVARFAAFVTALEDATGAIQIVHPDDYAEYAANTALLRSRLEGLHDAAKLAASVGASPALIVEHMFDHDKSYLVSMSSIGDLMAAMARAAAPPDPVEDFLDGTTNTHTVSQLMVPAKKRRAHLAEYAAHLPALGADWSNAAYYQLKCADAAARPFKNFRLMMQELLGPVMMQLHAADPRDIVTDHLADLKADYPMLPGGYFDKLLERLDDVFPP